MSEPTNGAQQPNPEREKDAADLEKELREMAQQIGAAFRAVLESERAQQLRKDLSSGTREIAEQLRKALETAQSDPRVQQAEERGKNAIHQAGESKFVQDLQEVVVNGLTQINAQLRRVVSELEKERDEAAAAPKTEHVPVESDPPATGDTTRL
jgi:ATP/maltotriose-dependent transcriptional regulator MalT